jgi:Family of unknown function (DUF6734)
MREVTVRAVWSSWSKPLRAGTVWYWRSPINHLLTWGLSFRLAQSHDTSTVLVRDRPGRALLVDALCLPFESVSTAPDQLAGADPRLWTLGKPMAHSVQGAPFMHLGSGEDAFLRTGLALSAQWPGPADQHPQTMARLDDPVRTEDPDFYARCEFVHNELAAHPRT